MFNNTRYILTTNKLEKMPQDDVPEFVIVGKSNVGKSTFINYLTNNSSLAKISSKPGKTRAISFFDVEKSKFRIVDIPGYGYAKVSKQQLVEFANMIDEYLSKRKNIVKAILLLDIRRSVSENDLDMVDYFIRNEIPFVVVGTKRDKCNQKEIHKFNLEISKIFQVDVVNYSSKNKSDFIKLKEIFNI